MKFRTVALNCLARDFCSTEMRGVNLSLFSRQDGTENFSSVHLQGSFEKVYVHFQYEQSLFPKIGWWYWPLFLFIFVYNVGLLGFIMKIHTWTFKHSFYFGFGSSQSS